MELRRTFEIVQNLYSNYKDTFKLGVKRKGKWEEFSAEQYLQYSKEFAMGLLELGFSKDDKILTMSNNRPEWNFADMGMSQIGAVHVPIYTNLNDEEILYILEHSEAKMVIVSSAEFYLQVKPLVEKVSNVKYLYTFDDVPKVENWKEIVELGRKNSEKWEAKLEEIKQSIKPEDLLTIIYTSGTTGKPKGVMLSHKNLMSNIEYSKPRYPLEAGHKYLSVLPICHVFERMVNYMVQTKGISVYYAERIETFVNDLKEIQANGSAAVPRLFERLYDGIIVKGKKLTGFKRTMFDWAVNLGLKYDPNESPGFLYNFKLNIARKLVFKKWQEALGGEVLGIISGGAALQPRLARIFNAAGIPVFEGYGMTETSPVIAVNYPGNIKIGTVGRILENVEAKIAEDGELIVRGPNIMMGYYKDPEKTAAVLEPDGWLHTGDIGEIDEDNYLKITDRKKEIFKLDTGKYVAPQVVENIFKESDLIEQLLVVGEKEKFVAAIIAPNFEYLNGWAFKNGIIYRDAHDLIKNPKVIQRYQQEVDLYNKRLSHHEQIKKFELTCRRWTPETGELSPTLKLKRRFLKKLYKVKLDHIYGYTDDSGDLGLRDKVEDPDKD